MPKTASIPYTEDQLQQALAAVRSGMSKKRAATVFGVPRPTIRFRLSDKFTKTSKGPSPILTSAEEDILVNWIDECSRRGFPRRKEDLQLSVQTFLRQQKRNNPFTNDMPGDGWYRAFVRRHPRIALRTPEEVTRASACVSENDIRLWFTTTKDLLKEESWDSILDDPSRVFNSDETGVSLNPCNGRVLCLKGTKNVYEIDKGPSKSNITAMCSFSAIDAVVPPLLIYPYKARIPSEIAQSIPDTWGIGHSENGWMTADVFYNYLKTIFSPFLLENNITLPVILFIDGHKSHVSLQVSELCKELQIILIALYPNATRILQPCDVGLFKPLKSHWRTATMLWYHDNPDKVLTKEYFAPVFKTAFNNAINAQIIKNSFSATGLHPWDPNKIDFSKCLGGKKSAKNEETYLSKTMFDNIVGEEIINKLKDIADQDDDSVEPTLKLLKQISAAFTLPPVKISKPGEVGGAENDGREKSDREETKRTDGHEPEQINEQEVEQTLGKKLEQTEDLTPGNNSNSDTLLTAEHKHSNPTDTCHTSATGYTTQKITQQLNEEKVLDKPPEITNQTAIEKHILVQNNKSTVSLAAVLPRPPTPVRKGVRQTKRMPYVLTGEKCKKYFRVLEEEKQKKKDEAETRKKKREEQRKLKEDEKNNKKKQMKNINKVESDTSDSGEYSEHDSDSDLSVESDEDSDITKENIDPGNFCVAKVFTATGTSFRLYVTKIIDSNINGCTVTFYKRIAGSMRFAETDEKGFIKHTDIIRKLSKPIVNKSTRFTGTISFNNLSDLSPIF